VEFTGEGGEAFCDYDSLYKKFLFYCRNWSCVFRQATKIDASLYKFFFRDLYIFFISVV